MVRPGGDPAAGISVVCVFNDPEVRAGCLDRSLRDYSGPVNVDYIPVDNTEHTYPSAGAALNHGARQARHDVVVFAHQDVYLHSIDRLAMVGAELQTEQWAILGACGSPARGDNVGRMRDRLQLIGSNADSPVSVHSVDEVVFMVRRDRVLDDPFTEDPDLAWHAYAVEYGVRMRRRGLRVGAVNLAVTHNSLTINLARFEASHRRVAQLFPDMLPVRTTCGTVGSRSAGWRAFPVLGRHAWRLRWLEKSLRAALVRRSLRVPVVLSDIRDDVDLLHFSAVAPLHVINVDQEGGFVEHAGGVFTLTRRGKPVTMWTVASLPEMLATLDSLPSTASVLVADLSLDDLRAVEPYLDGRSDWVTGIQHGAVWLLGGPAVRDLPGRWSASRAVPLGARRPWPVASR